MISAQVIAYYVVFVAMSSQQMSKTKISDARKIAAKTLVICRDISEVQGILQNF